MILVIKWTALVTTSAALAFGAGVFLLLVNSHIP